MAGECDNDIDQSEIKLPEIIEKKNNDVRDENLLEDILVNSHPNNKINKADPLAEILNVSSTFFKPRLI